MLPLNLATRVKTSGSILTSLLWMFGTSSALCSTLYFARAGVPAHLALGMTFLIGFFILYVYWHFMSADPDRLHSENHLQQMKSIGLMGDSVHGGVTIDTDIARNPNLGTLNDHR